MIYLFVVLTNYLLFTLCMYFIVKLRIINAVHNYFSRML